MNTPSADVMNVVQSSCSYRRIAVLREIHLRLGPSANGGRERMNVTPTNSSGYTDGRTVTPTRITNLMKIINPAVRRETLR